MKTVRVLYTYTVFSVLFVVGYGFIVNGYWIKTVPCTLTPVAEGCIAFYRDTMVGLNTPVEKLPPEYLQAAEYAYVHSGYIESMYAATWLHFAMSLTAYTALTVIAVIAFLVILNELTFREKRPLSAGVILERTIVGIAIIYATLYVYDVSPPHFCNDDKCISYTEVFNKQFTSNSVVEFFNGIKGDKP